MQFLLQDIHGHVGFLYDGSLLLGLWQCLLVHLLVLVQWYGVDLHRHSRHHVRRLLVEDEVIQRLDIN